MAKNGTSWKPGQSGNPRGRPPNERALTKLVERALSKSVDYKGKRTARKRVMADILAEAATTGKVTFPDGEELELSGKEWIDFVMKAMDHIDGPARRELDLNVDGSLEVTGLGAVLDKIYGDGDS